MILINFISVVVGEWNGLFKEFVEIFIKIVYMEWGYLFSRDIVGRFLFWLDGIFKGFFNFGFRNFYEMGFLCFINFRKYIDI